MSYTGSEFARGHPGTGTLFLLASHLPRHGIDSVHPCTLRGRLESRVHVTGRLHSQPPEMASADVARKDAGHGRPRLFDEALRAPMVREGACCCTVRKSERAGAATLIRVCHHYHRVLYRCYAVILDFAVVLHENTTQSNTRARADNGQK